MGDVRWRCGERQRRGRECPSGVKGSGAVFGSGLPRGPWRAIQGAMAMPGGHREFLPGRGEEGKGLLPCVDLLCRDVVLGGVGA